MPLSLSATVNDADKHFDILMLSKHCKLRKLVRSQERGTKIRQIRLVLLRTEFAKCTSRFGYSKWILFDLNTVQRECYSMDTV